MRYAPEQENLPTDLAAHRGALGARLLHTLLALHDIYPKSNFGVKRSFMTKFKISLKQLTFSYIMTSENVPLINVYPSSIFCSNPTISK